MAEAADLRGRFLSLALPNILANLMVPLAGLMDTAMLGHFSAVRELGGVALGTLVFDYLLWTFGFLRMGTTGLTAQAYGARDAIEQGRVLGRGFLLAACLSALLLCLSSALADLCFQLLEGDAGVKAAGRRYYDARIWGAPAALTNFVLHGFLLGRQRARQVLALSAVFNGVNVGLDYLFIARWGWGAAGAGYATLAGQLAALVLGGALTARELARAQIRFSRGVFEPRGLGAFLRLGGALVVRTFALLTGFAIFTDISAALGPERLASNTLLQKAVTLCAFFVDGYAFAVESMAGALRGGGQPAALRRLLALALRWGVTTGLACAGAFALFPEALFGLLTDHPQLLAAATADRAWLFPILGLGAVAWVLDGYFLGLSEGRTLRRSQVAVLLFFLPWAWWARAAHSAQLLWFAFSLFTAARAFSLARYVPDTFAAAPSRAQRSS